MPDIACLIEGGLSLKEHYHVDIQLAATFAELNKLDIFDPIASFTNQQVSELYQKFPKEKRPIVVAFLLTCQVTDKGHKSYQEMSEVAFDFCLKKKVYPKEEEGIPAWLAELNPKTADNFLQNVIAKHFSGDEKKFQNYFQDLLQEFLAITNSESKTNTLNYLRAHPEIKTVIGLIGQYHLPMLKEVSTVKTESEHSIHLELDIDTRIITLYLYGSFHGSVENFLAFRNKMAELQFITDFPAEPVLNDKKSSSSYETLLSAWGKPQETLQVVTDEGFDPFASDSENEFQHASDVSEAEIIVEAEINAEAFNPFLEP